MECQKSHFLLLQKCRNNWISKQILNELIIQQREKQSKKADSAKESSYEKPMNFGLLTLLTLPLFSEMQIRQLHRQDHSSTGVKGWEEDRRKPSCSSYLCFLLQCCAHVKDVNCSTPVFCSPGLTPGLGKQKRILHWDCISFFHAGGVGIAWN